MLVKKTTRNRITLPKAIADRFAGVEYFDVQEEAGRIVLVPMFLGRAEGVRARLEERGITPDDVHDAVAWARRQ